MIWLNGFIVIFLLWYLASKFNWVDNTLLASPKETLNVLINSFNFNIPENEQLFLHAKHTIFKTFHGWFISLILGLVLGLMFGFIIYLMKSFEIAIEFFRAIPPVLAFPLMLVLFNYEGLAYIWTIVFGCLPIMVLTVSKGVQHISKQSIEILKVHGISTFKISIIKAIEMLPSIFLGARVTFSFALIIAVVTEMILTPRNGLALGALARDAEINFQTPIFYAIIIILGLLGFFVNTLLKKAEKIFDIKQ